MMFRSEKHGKLMPNQGTESQFEETTIDRLHALGYRYQYGGDLERDWREVVMTDWLRAFLHKKYPHLPVGALEEAIVRASRPAGITPEHRNMHFHELLTRGFEQKYRQPDGVETFEHIYLVDWANPDANDFCIVNQLPIRGQNDRRPDIIIYLNGFPLVLFELKNPYEEEPNTLGAFNQVQHYKAGISNCSTTMRSLSFPMAVWWAGRMTTHRTPSARHCTACGGGVGMVCAVEEHQWPGNRGQCHRCDEDAD